MEHHDTTSGVIYKTLMMNSTERICIERQMSKIFGEETGNTKAESEIDCVKTRGWPKTPPGPAPAPRQSTGGPSTLVGGLIPFVGALQAAGGRP